MDSSRLADPPSAVLIDSATSPGCWGVANSGLYACGAGTLLPEPPPWPTILFCKKLFRRLLV